MTLAPLKRIRPYFVANRRTILFGVLFLVVVDFLQLLIPRVVKHAVDNLTALQTTPQDLARQAALLVVIALLIGGFRYLWRRCLIGTSRKVEAGLRDELFVHVQQLSAPFFSRTKTGDIMAHATNDITQVRMAVGMGMVALTDALVLGTAAVGFMAYINLRLTLLVLIPMPLIVAGTRLLGGRMHQRYRDVQAAFSEMTETVREQLAGIRIIKGHGLEERADRRTAAISRGYIRRNLQLARIVGAFFPMMILLTNMSLAVVLYFGGRMAITGEISPGDFVAFISYLGLLTWPMMALGWVTNLIQRGRASLERLDRILNTRPDIPAASGTLTLADGPPEVVFDNVSFAYPAADDSKPDSPRTLRDIRVRVPAGSVLGIVGPPGSGKSTLLNLLPRIFDAGAGTLRIGGRDVRSLRLDHLRGRVALVPQEPFLFADTLRANLAIGDPDAGPGALRRAAARAALLETIEGFTDGFDTRVGERGVVLSGGQKQRVGLARALLSAAPLLVLDDPVSQLDADTARKVIEAIRAEAGRRTVVIASHRLAAVRFADRILTLESGRIVENGTHRQLAAAGGFYARTDRLQHLERQLDAR